VLADFENGEKIFVCFVNLNTTFLVAAKIFGVVYSYVPTYIYVLLTG